MAPRKKYLFSDLQQNFGPSDSGNNSHLVIYRNYPGEQPVIHRGRKIVGWQPDTAGIYKAPVDLMFHALYENGVRAVIARYPNVTESNPNVYNTTSATVTGSETQKFGFLAGDVPVASNPAALEVALWNGGPTGEYNWFRDDWTVSSVDYSARVLTLLKDLTTNTSGRGYAIGAGTRYFVQGAKELIDQPGEFWVGNGFVYYRPRQTPIDQQVILAPGPSGGGIFSFQGNSPTDTVHDIELRGLTFAFTDRYQHAISLSNAERINLKGAHIFNTGGAGILLSGNARNNVIQGNLIHDTGDAGIKIAGSSAANPSQNLIDNNHIHHVGQVTPQGSGIDLALGNANVITHNLVHDVPRFCISISGMLPGTNGILAPLTTNNRVAYNDVSRAMLDSQDGGSIYIWGAGPGNVIDSNRVHDSDLPFSYGQGIYVDHDNLQTTVSNNLVHDLQQHPGGITFSGILLKGATNQAVNNIVAQNRFSSGELQISESPEIPSQGAQILRNIFALNNVDRFYSFTIWDETQVGAADYNLFQHDAGAYNAGFGFGSNFGQTGSQNVKETLPQWRAGHNKKFDQNSITGDPKFVDVANRDFRLRPDSPAYGLGFADIDFGSIGLSVDFPYSDSSEQLARIFVNTVQSGPGATTRLSLGDTTQLTISGRTKTGYLVPVPYSAVAFSSDTPAVAKVDAQGNISALATGNAAITASVTRAGVTTSTVMFVVVGNFTGIGSACKGTPVITSVSSASDFGGSPRFASGSWLEIKGSNLAAGTRLWAGGDFQGNLAPTALSGSSVTVNGKKGYVYYISPTQINVQAPDDTVLGASQISVTNCAGVSSPFTSQRVAISPGMLAPGVFNINGTQYLAALFQDGATFVGKPGLIAGVPFRPAKPGEAVTAYGIGFGAVTPAIASGTVVDRQNQIPNLAISFGQTPAVTTYAGLAPGNLGLYQFNIIVPNVPDGDYQVNISTGGVALAQTIFATIQR